MFFMSNIFLFISMRTSNSLLLKGLAVHWSALNPLRAKGEEKHAFTCYVIRQHWYDAGIWTPSSCKARANLFYIVNAMAADALAT